jgi:hypothetical protein
MTPTVPAIRNRAAMSLPGGCPEGSALLDRRQLPSFASVVRGWVETANLRWMLETITHPSSLALSAPGHPDTRGRHVLTFSDRARETVWVQATPRSVR